MESPAAAAAATTGDPEDYWNTSANKSFSFDIDECDNDNSSPSQLSTDGFNRYRLLADDNVSEISFEFQSNDIPLNTIISDNDLKIILDDQSLKDSPFRKGISQEEELKLLRRKVQDMIHPPPVETTANKLLLGKICSLESYKALCDKEQLLDEVIKTGNGDGILAVVLFLSKTLNKRQLYRILQTRQEACNQYLNYLTIRMKISEASDILTMLGRDTEAAMLQFKIAVQMHSDPQLRKQRLKRVYCDYFTQSSSSSSSSSSTLNSLYSQIIANAINLMEWQLLEQSKTSDSVIDIANSSPIESLYYACTKYKWKDQNSNDLMNPYKFCQDYQINPLQFEWTALNERAKSKAYPDLNGIFEKQSWGPLNKKQFHINIPLEIAIQRLYELNAPTPVLYQFISKVNDSNLKLSLAKQTNCIRGIIDALVQLKEKQELEEYKDTLIQGSEERFYAENSLKNMNKKWSTEGIKLIKS